MTEETPDEGIRPPGVDDEEDVDMFENFDAILMNGLDVVDEVGGSDDEVKTDTKNSRKKDNKRSSSRERRRSASNKRRTRSRSRDRNRISRERHRPSPGKTSTKNGTKKGGAAAFLADLKEQFGEFPELIEMNRPSVRRQAEKELRLSSKRGGQDDFSRGDRRNNQYNQQNFEQQQQYPMGWVPMGMAMGPLMPMGPQMPMQYGQQMPYNNGPPMMNVGMQQPMMYPGVPPENTMMGGPPMMMDNNSMEGSGLSMPLQIPGRPPFDGSSRISRSRSPSLRSRQRSRSSERYKRSPYRGRSRSDSRDRMRRSIDRGSVDRVGRSNYYRPNIDLDDMTSQLFADQNMSYADFLTSRAPGSSTTLDSIRARVISKCKAAVHMLEHPNDIEYNLKFLFVPPSYSASAVDKSGLSPVLPSKRNPLFKLTTVRNEAVAACKPFQNLPEHIITLIRQLGLDESVISQKLDANLIAHKMLEARQQSTQESFDGNLSSFYHKPLMTSTATQTPFLVCIKCDKREQRKMDDRGTQTRRKECIATSCQTMESDMTLAKLRLQTWEREQTKGEKRNKDAESLDSKPKRSNIGPPGFCVNPKDQKSTTADAFYSAKEKTYGYSYRR